MRSTLLLMLCALPLASQPGPAEETVYDDGVVTATVTNTRDEPVAGAWVILEGQSPSMRRAPPAPQPKRISRHSTTDAAGRARFTSVPSGSYNLRAQMAGRHFSGRTNHLSLSGAEAEGQVEIALPQKPVLTGRVVDWTGAPVTQARVKTFRRGFQNGQETLGPGRPAQTDDRGVYRIALEEPGLYWLMASHTERAYRYGSAPRSTGVAFHPNAPDLITAAPIEVAFDQPERTLDLTLPPAPRTSLNAPIVSGGRPCRQCRYSLRKVDGPFEYEIISAGAGANAAVDYAGIPAGLYRVYVEDHGLNPGAWAIDELVVAEGRPTEALLSTRSPISVAGRVVLEEPPNELPELPENVQRRIQVNLQRKGPHHFFSGGGGQSAAHLEVDPPDFQFTALPPAPHRVEAYVHGANAYLARITRQGRPVPSPVLDLSQPGPWDDLVLHLRFDHAQPWIAIDGPEEDETGEVIQYQVEMVPDEQATPFGQRISSQLSARGRSQLSHVPPGRYRVVAIASAFPNRENLQDPKTWEKLSPWTRTVDLEPGENPAIHLTPAPASALARP